MIQKDILTVNLGPLIDLLSSQYDTIESRFAGMEMIPSFIMCAAFALEEYPTLNGNHKQVNIGLKNGDLHFMIRDANYLDMGQIEDDIIRAIKSKNIAETWDDEETFSIVNTGMLEEVEDVIAEIEHPVSAIMGIHAINQRPYAVDKKTTTETPCMDISLTYRSNVISKEDARHFLEDIKQLLENPEASDE